MHQRQGTVPSAVTRACAVSPGSGRQGRGLRGVSRVGYHSTELIHLLSAVPGAFPCLLPAPLAHSSLWLLSCHEALAVYGQTPKPEHEAACPGCPGCPDEAPDSRALGRSSSVNRQIRAVQFSPNSPKALAGDGDSLTHLLLSPACPQEPEVSCEEWHSCPAPGETIICWNPNC